MQLIDSIGQETGRIPIELSTRFLQHFSEQLYSSPQKAFEELISNSWDAGADCVDVRIPSDLSAVGATLSVLDNGASMDEEGLRQLWHIAFSPKKGNPTQFGRNVIGKFGIGKLATYVLASKLTYLCKATDGKIRRVTMDYTVVDQQAGEKSDKLISELDLTLYEVDEKEVEEALKSVCDGSEILDLIKKGVPKPEGKFDDDDYGASASTLSGRPRDTWTLVILSDLKPVARSMKVGVLRRMLCAALPIGSEMAISINNELLASSKVNAPIKKEWRIGPDLKFTELEYIENGEAKKLKITSKLEPFPHVEIPGIGIVSGRARLYEDIISGGKSDERGASNGFHVNVLGRIVNQSNPSFGEDNLSHAAWARFRLTVRVDGLNQFLTTDREKFQEKPELAVFRAFLRKVFNLTRNHYDSDQSAILPDGGDVLVKSLGVVSLNPLRNVVSEALKSAPQLPGLFDETGIDDREKKRTSWREETAEHIQNALGDVKYEKLTNDSFVQFRIADSAVIVNKEHPFVVEHSRTKAEKELLRTVALVSLLTDVYALDIGVAPATLENIRNYRDKLMRYRAMQSRQSGSYIAKLLLQMQHDSANSKLLEAVLSDALRYLGFQVRDLAKPGEPEGIASAYPYPTKATPSADNPAPPLYSVSFDAKASKHEAAKTGNISLDGIVEHRERYKANYALVVAPGFQEGALDTRAEQQRVTPMAARDLGKLLEYTVEYGAIPLTKLREVFELTNPKAVSEWVANLEDHLKAVRPLTIDIFLSALEHLKGQIPDALAASHLASVSRSEFKAFTVKEEDVLALARGLEILVPDLVGVQGEKIVVNASAARVRAAVAAQLDDIQALDVKSPQRKEV